MPAAANMATNGKAGNDAPVFGDTTVAAPPTDELELPEPELPEPVLPLLVLIAALYPAS